jgi:hypothetical protein
MSATAQYVIIASYALPPYVLEKACDANADCVGFMATASGSGGWLLGWAPNPTGSTGTIALLLDKLERLSTSVEH